ncbi:hypothetical protein [Ideonella sp.]|uniref:hypothetical protein n=1 Tax=Ideonella sp. TaxID=1929293 RepID=UPI00351B1A5E
MARYLLQSALTWEFLHPSPRTGDVTWTPSLLTAIEFGVIEDEEEVQQLINDHCDRGRVLIVNLDA